MNFTKLQGAGNDFVLVEGGQLKVDWSRTAMTVCDRHFGIGADGLLVLLPSELASFRMRVFNPDGSEAETCGNGLRCMVKYIIERGLAGSEVEQISVETVAGVRQTRIKRVGGKPAEIQVGMGEPRFGAGDVPVLIEAGEGEILDINTMIRRDISIGNRELLLNLISIGNPHAVYFWQYPVADFPLSELGYQIERLKMFPHRTNFEVARVLSRRRIEVRVWERGVGETLACGSGAGAVAVAARKLGYVDDGVEIELPGGVLEVEWGGEGEVLLGGPAEIVFSGEWLA